VPTSALTHAEKDVPEGVTDPSEAPSLPEEPPGGRDAPSGGSHQEPPPAYPVGIPEDDPLEADLEPLIEPIPGLEPPPKPDYDEELLTREGVNAFLARQLGRTDLKPDEQARFVDLVNKVNGIYGKGDEDLRRLPNDAIEEKWRVVSQTLEPLGVRIDFDTGKKPKGRPRKNEGFRSVETKKIGHDWRTARRPNRPYKEAQAG